jgi:hypothetical protein
MALEKSDRKLSWRIKLAFSIGALEDAMIGAAGIAP